MRLLTFLLLFGPAMLAQSRTSVSGRVLDSETRTPLPFATIGITGKPEQTISRGDGSFELEVPSSYVGDSLVVTYLGYSSYIRKITALPVKEDILMKQSFTLLEEVVIANTRLNIRKVEKDLRVIRGTLYAMEAEVTNEQYNLFLTSLLEEGKLDLHKKCDYQLSMYDSTTQAFFRRYVTQYRVRGKYKDSVNVRHIGPHDWGDYPAVNVSYEGAQQYCHWLTQKYNEHSGRKKYKKVKFRLPALHEWQIAALGYDKFQTWELEKNVVEVWISGDSLEIAPKKGVRKTLPVGKDILYPWYGSYYYRRSLPTRARLVEEAGMMPRPNRLFIVLNLTPGRMQRSGSGCSWR